MQIGEKALTVHTKPAPACTHSQKLKKISQ